MVEAQFSWEHQQAQFLALADMRNALRFASWEHLATLSGAASLEASESEALANYLRRVGALAAASLLEPEVAARMGEEVLWLLECVAEGGPTPWWHQQLTAWRASLEPSLRDWLDSREDAFAARLAQARQGVEPSVPAAQEGEPAASDLERELLQALAKEVEERLQSCEELLLAFEKAPANTDTVHALFRHYHSLKGAAAAVGLERAAEQLHQGESLLQAVRDGEIEIESGALVDFFLVLGDSVRALLQAACGQRPASEPIEDVEQALAQLLQGAPPKRDRGVAAASGSEAAALFPASDPEEIRNVVQLLQSKGTVGNLDPEVVALIAALERKAQLASARAAELEREVLELSTVPLDEVFRRLPRVARDACRQEGKEATLELAGESVRIERAQADRLGAVLTHLVRNAIAHGIELPAVRVRQGKPTQGRVRVTAGSQAGSLVVAVEDDGAGFDFAAIRSRAASLGLLSPEADPGQEELLEFVFRPGFSTRAEANEVAGRGVGMDAVLAEVRALGGAVRVQSQAGKGTRVEISLPQGKVVRGRA